MVAKARDVTYDVLKGIAIILVVLGHTIQYLDKDFDNNLLFNTIYSFHMPLFMFISGAVLSIGYKEHLSFSDFYIRLKKSMLRLFLPFLSWTVVLYFTTLRYKTMSLMDWFNMVAHQLDYSLWFFVALLLCIVFFYITQLIVEYLLGQQGFIRSIIGSLVIFLLLVSMFPSVPGVAYLKEYYPYFIAGMVWHRKLKSIDIQWLGYLVMALFFILIPIWTRTDSIFFNATADHIYRMVVAFSGIYMSYRLSLFIVSCKKLEYLKKILIILGSASLGIYAIHFNFIAISPYFISSLLLSMGLIYMIHQSKVLSFMLLGENKFNKGGRDGYK